MVKSVVDHWDQYKELQQHVHAHDESSFLAFRSDWCIPDTGRRIYGEEECIGKGHLFGKVIVAASKKVDQSKDYDQHQFVVNDGI